MENNSLGNAIEERMRKSNGICSKLKINNLSAIEISDQDNQPPLLFPLIYVIQMHIYVLSTITDNELWKVL